MGNVLLLENAVEDSQSHTCCPLLINQGSQSSDTASGWNRSRVLPRSAPMQGPGEGSAFQGRDGDAQQDGVTPCCALGAAGGTWQHLSSVGSGLCRLALVIPVLEAAGCSPRAVRLLAGGTIKHCDPACLQQETMR